MAKLCEKSVDVDAKTVTFLFAGGQKVVADVKKMTAEIVNRATLHGISQKGGDSYAGAESVDEAYEACKEIIDQLLAGDWKAARGEGAPRATQLALALSEATGQELDACVERIAACTDEQRKGLRKHPDIRPVLSRLAAEAAIEKAERDRKLAQSAEGAPDLSAMFG